MVTEFANDVLEVGVYFFGLVMLVENAADLLLISFLDFPVVLGECIIDMTFDLGSEVLVIMVVVVLLHLVTII